jgi:hypothetical protein
VLVRSVEHRACLRHARGQRLFAQDMFTRAHRSNRPFRVQAIRQWVVDGVNLGVGEQRFVGFDTAGNSQFLSETLRLVQVAARDRGDRDTLRGPHGQREAARNAGGTENSDAKDVSQNPFPSECAAARIQC